MLLLCTLCRLAVLWWNVSTGSLSWVWTSSALSAGQKTQHHKPLCGSKHPQLQEQTRAPVTLCWGGASSQQQSDCWLNSGWKQIPWPTLKHLKHCQNPPTLRTFYVCYCVWLYVLLFCIVFTLITAYNCYFVLFRTNGIIKSGIKTWTGTEYIFFLFILNFSTTEAWVIKSDSILNIFFFYLTTRVHHKPLTYSNVSTLVETRLLSCASLFPSSFTVAHLASLRSR